MQPVPRRLLMVLIAATTTTLVIAALLGGVLLGRPSAAPAAPPVNVRLTSSNAPVVSNDATVSVTGTGTVEGAPDTLTLQLGISATGSSAVGALAQANTEMAALERAFSPVSKKQLQTSGLNLGANYNQYGEITGYSASEQLTVVMHDIALAGRLIDDAAAAAGNFAQINGISFSISNSSALLAQARAQAMQAAHTEAAQLAAGAGVTLGQLKSVTDQPQQSQPAYQFGPDQSLAASAKTVPLEAGQQALTVQVSVVYDLVQ
jgi:uncharacterized protein YggE